MTTTATKEGWRLLRSTLKAQRTGLTIAVFAVLGMSHDWTPEGDEDEDAHEREDAHEKEDAHQHEHEQRDASGPAESGGTR